MNFDIDVAIVVVFLVGNLVAGLYSGRNIKNFEEYAIGNRNFSTSTITATLVATWIGGGFFAIGVSQTYQDGLFYIFASFGEIIAFLVVAYLFSGRMREFLGKLSLSEVAGELYGKNVRIIAAVACIAISAGAIALQLKVISSLFSYFFGLSSIYAVLASSFIIIIYSAFGGIKSVTFTDMIQFLTFGAFVPIFALFVWKVLGDHQTIINNVKNSPLFDYRELFNYHNPKFLPYLALFIYSATLTPLDPSLFQRVLLAKDIRQIRQSFVLAAFVGLFVLLASCSIGVIIYGHDSQLEPNNLVMYIIDNYSYTGLKGLVLVGILAITMSTADSWINVASVIFSHDFCKPLGINFEHSKLLISRIFSVLIGFFGITLALSAHNLLDLILLIGNFFCPVVGPILFLGIIGFRSTPNAAIAAICSGIVTAIIWRIYWQEETNIDSVMTGTLANLIAFLLFHYAFVGSKLKRNRIGKEINDSGKRKNLIDLSVIIHKLGSFNLLAYCEKNASKHENTYIPFGVFSILFMVCNSILLDADLYKENLVLMNIVQGLVLGLSTLLITYKLWLEALKRKHVALVWYVTIFISSVVSSIVLIAGSDTILMPLMVFSINLLVISYLLKWQETILMLLCGMIIAYIGCCCYFDKSVTDLNFSASKFSIMYFFLMLTSSFIFFLKPKQEYVEATEQKADALEGEKAILDHKVADLDTQVKTLEVQKVRLTGDVTALGLQVRSVKDERAKLIHEVSNLGAHVTNLEGEKARLNSQITGLSAEVTDLASQVGDLNEQVTHYTEQIADKDKEIDRLGQTSQRILNNVSHELRLPIGNVVNFSEMLTETLGKTENNKLMKELAKEVYDNSNRVSSMILNMLDLATLAVKKVDLEKTMVNFSELVLERVRRCQKIYQNSKNIEFKLDIEPEILISVDPNYMRQTVDNLVINSITFSKQGLITISVTKKDGEVIFTITDQGVGIPDGQLTDIFTPFKMGANTESKAQGRGVGLALCKSAIEAHGGSIIANSDGECGAELQFTLPFKNNQ